jgi:hypoxanthine phosphoribosyltransferase
MKSLFKPVITLNPASFTKACISLAEEIEKSGNPDLIVTIPRAGEYIHNEILKNELFKTASHVNLTIQRPSTKHKQKLKIGKLLKILPVCINNFLRKSESFYQELVFYFALQKNKSVLLFTEETKEKIELCNNIVIIDDAIDSGKSIDTVLSFIHKNNQNAHIRVAVITTTFTRPKVQPEISLFKHQLIRFHWSEDYAR